jgi:hypothetical protein
LTDFVVKVENRTTRKTEVDPWASLLLRRLSTPLSVIDFG